MFTLIVHNPRIQLTEVLTICQLQDLILRVSQNTHYAITKFLLNCSLPITCLRVISHLHIFTDDILDKFTLF